jgi:small subunit ribosomal protein S8
MLIRIKNAQAVGHQTVSLPFSKMKFTLAQILNSHGYLGIVRETEKGARKKIEVSLKYRDKKNTLPVIQGIERISRSGQRIYVNKKELTGISRGQGIAILTTSSGLMIDKDAKKMGIGGEVICRIW